MTHEEDSLLWQQLCAEMRPLHKDNPVAATIRKPEPLKTAANPAPPKDRLFGDKVTKFEFSAQNLLRPQQNNIQQKNLATIQHDRPQTFTELDGRRAQRFRSGKLKPDAVLDLHGLREHEAADDFARFFARALRQKHRCLLVVTGKGSGVLHRALARWLEAPQVRKYLAGVASMPHHKGGRGAYGLYLRG